MSTEDNKALARRFFAEVVTGGNLALVEDIFAASVTFNGRPAGHETIKQVVANTRTAFPDIEVIIEDQVAEGDKVTTRRTFRGTHLGEYVTPWGRVPPTGKRVEWRLLSIVRFVDAKIVEDWVVPDTLGLLQQLGAKVTLPG